jgi:hypothetical protein
MGGPTGRRPRPGPARPSQIAAELIQLYAARQAAPGVRVRPGHALAAELEDAFPYVETPDQLTTIDEVKARHGAPVPMDRLICGDVGYGKTEIAVRAAFKAVQDGKQVAVLVPTTLLVQQHCRPSPSGTRRSRSTSGPVALPERRGGADTVRASWPTARWTSSSAPTGCCGRPALRRPRPGGGRRGAALRGGAQGAPQGAAGQRRRAHDVGHPDPAHAGDVDHRHPGDVDDHHPAGGAPPRADLRRGGTTSRWPPRSGASCPRGAGLLRAQPGGHDREGRGPGARAGARGPGGGGPRADGRAQARAGHRRLLGAPSPTCWCAPRSSRPAWTSPTPTR